MSDTFIRAIGYYIPGGRLTNNEVLERFAEENRDRFSEEELDYVLYGNQRKFEFLGVDTRAYCKEDEQDNIVSMSVKACMNAIEKSGLSIQEIDCIIFSGVSNPFREPSFAIVLAKHIGIESGDFFDINDTCNGFMKSMELASLYIKSGKYKNILIATSENPFEIGEGMGADFKVESSNEVDNRFTTLFVGCGAAAMVISAEGGQRKIIDYAERRESKDWDASLFTVPNVNIPPTRFGGKNKGFLTDARRVSSLIIKDMPEFVREKVREWNMDLNEIDLFIMHQLGNNVTFATLGQLGVSYDKAPVNTFREFGNMACANIPVNLAIAEERGFIKRGDSVLLLSSACGLSYSLIHIQW